MRMEKWKSAKAVVAPVLKEWSETIKSRPLCTAAVVVILSVLLVRGLSGDIEVGPVYDIGGDNAFARAGIFEGDNISLSGKVKDIREKENYGSKTYTIIISNPKFNGELLGGRGRYAQAYAGDAEGVKIGCEVELQGKLDYYDHGRNHGEFDSYAYYSGRGFLFALKSASVTHIGEKCDRMSDGLYRARQSLSEDISRIYDSTDAAILKAMLLGLKGDMDSEVKESFQKNGIAHILAISGLHISFLCMTLYGICIKAGCPIWLSVLISEVFLVTYVLLVGFSPSAFRAAIMFSLFLIAGICKRSYDMISAMSFASILILLYCPGYVTDASFQLSFLAILGVGFFYKNFLENSKFLKRIMKMRPSNTVKGWLYNKVVVGVISGGTVSFFVTMATLPVLLWSYCEVAFYSVLLNIIIVPLMSVLLVAAILSVLFVNTFPFMAFLPATVAKVILFIYKFLCSRLEGLGFGRVNLGRPSVGAIIIYYLILVIACLYKGKGKTGVKSLGIIGCIFLMCVPHWKGAQLHMLDVGQGDCFVFFTEKGHTYIFDGGSSSKSNIADKRIIPFLKYYGVNEIEAVFVSHPDSDHMNGITGLLEDSEKECIDVKRVFVYSEALDAGAFDDLLGASDKETLIYGIEEGFELEDGELRITCIYPGTEEKCDELLREASDFGNNSSLVMKLEYGDFTFLETGDIETGGELAVMEHLPESCYKADVLKVAHHGSSSSSGKQFIENVAPRIALISAGENNSYGHPHKETLETLEREEAEVMRTDLMGEVWLEIGKNGGKYEVRKYAN